MRGLMMMLAVGCGPTVEQLRERELCYAVAEESAQKRVDAECGGSFRTCPTADAILDELRLRQEACP